MYAVYPIQRTSLVTSKHDQTHSALTVIDTWDSITSELDRGVTVIDTWDSITCELDRGVTVIDTCDSITCELDRGVTVIYTWDSITCELDRGVTVIDTGDSITCELDCGVTVIDTWDSITCELDRGVTVIDTWDSITCELDCGVTVIDTWDSITCELDRGVTVIDTWDSITCELDRGVTVIDMWDSITCELDCGVTVIDTCDSITCELDCGVTVIDMCDSITCELDCGVTVIYTWDSITSELDRGVTVIDTGDSITCELDRGVTVIDTCDSITCELDRGVTVIDTWDSITCELDCGVTVIDTWDSITCELDCGVTVIDTWDSITCELDRGVTVIDTWDSITCELDCGVTVIDTWDSITCELDCGVTVIDTWDSITCELDCGVTVIDTWDSITCELDSGVTVIDTYDSITCELDSGVTVIDTWASITCELDCGVTVILVEPSLKVTSAKYLKNKVTRLCEQKKKLASKKKVPGVKNLIVLNAAVFEAPVTLTHANRSNLQEEDKSSLNETIQKLQNISVNEEPSCISVSIQTDFENEVDFDNSNKCTHFNLLKYEACKLEKHSRALEKKILEQKEHFTDTVNRNRHYSVRNVNKRDDTAKRNLHSLRDSQRLALKQERMLKEMSQTLINTTQKLRDAEIVIEQQPHNSKCLAEDVSLLRQNLEKEKSKKLNVQKMSNYWRNELNMLRRKSEDCSNQLKEKQQMHCVSCEESNNETMEKDLKICELQDEIEKLLSEKVKTKNDNKCFSDPMRLCVVELSGLEVAAEKVPEVIRTVSKHLFKKDIQKNELPTSTTVQTIVDEGHFLAKTYISQKLSETENWGLNRDGTTRRKQKILDTALTLGSGEVMSLGFNRVANETAVTINEITKSHINELADLNTNIVTENDQNNESDVYIKNTLVKLAFTMSDRAANEKKASVLLSEWRDQILGENTQDYAKVNNFHCMAHVLLGFHTYICKDLKEYEKVLSAEHGPLGRDNMPVFKFWTKKKTVVERVLKTTSDVFGPSGVYHGVRDKWEAHCASKGIKSVIGNYKDNRFNGLFQTAAEVCHHRDEFVKVLETVKSPNLLLKSVLADLKSETVMTLIQALGLFYINLTGPYWNLIVGNKVPYLELYKEISLINEYLEKTIAYPETILKTYHWSEMDIYEIAHVPHKQTLAQKLTTIDNTSNCKEILLDTIKLAAKAIRRTIEKQLVDFLQDGKFSEQPTEKEMQRTSFAHLSNLGCEHHFGSLDSSQRRRPRASLHHHSSIQLIKQNRSKMFNWLTEMPDTVRTSLLKSARKGGKDLRLKHCVQERDVLNEINESMHVKDKKKPNKKRKAETNITNKEKRKQCDESDSENFSDYEEEAKLLEVLPSNKNININDYVAVAYQDTWYPGVVKTVVDSEKVIVTFMTPANKPGMFKWPARADIQTVEIQFIIVTGFIPDCVSSGRMWAIQSHKSIENIYKRFANIYF